MKNMGGLWSAGPGPPPAGELAIGAVDLVRSYQANRVVADKKYKNKVITVRGKVAIRANRESLVFLGTELKSILPNSAPNITDDVAVFFRDPADLKRALKAIIIAVRGRCEGFNRDFDVVLRDAVLVEVAPPRTKN
jgi:hypothetical protein